MLTQPQAVDAVLHKLLAAAAAAAAAVVSKCHHKHQHETAVLIWNTLALCALMQQKRLCNQEAYSSFFAAAHACSG